MAVVGVALLGGADLEVDGSRDGPLADRIGRAEEILAAGPAGRVTAGRLGRAVSDVVPLDRLLVIATRSDEGGDAGDTDGLATLYRNHSAALALPAVQVEVVNGNPVSYRSVLPAVAAVLERATSPADDHVILHGGGTAQLALALLLMSPVLLSRPTRPLVLRALTEGDAPAITLVRESPVLSGRAARWAVAHGTIEALQVAIGKRETEMVRALVRIIADEREDRALIALADVAARLQSRTLRIQDNGPRIPDLQDQLSELDELVAGTAVSSLIAPLLEESRRAHDPPPVADGHSAGGPCAVSAETLRRLALLEARAAANARPPRLAPFALHVAPVCESVGWKLHAGRSRRDEFAKKALKEVQRLRNALMHDTCDVPDPTASFALATRHAKKSAGHDPEHWTSVLEWLAQAVGSGGLGPDVVRRLLTELKDRVAARAESVPAVATGVERGAVAIAFASHRDPDLILSIAELEGDERLVIVATEQPEAVAPERRKGDTRALAEDAAQELRRGGWSVTVEVVHAALSDHTTVAKRCTEIVDGCAMQAQRVIVVDALGPKALRHPAIVTALDCAARTGAEIKVVSNFERSDPELVDLTRLLAALRGAAASRLALHELRAAGRADLEIEFLQGIAGKHPDEDARRLLALCARLCNDRKFDADEAPAGPAREALQAYAAHPADMRAARAAFDLDRAARGRGVVLACEFAAAITRLRDATNDWSLHFDQRNQLVHRIVHHVDDPWDPRPRASILNSLARSIDAADTVRIGSAWARSRGLELGPDPLEALLDEVRRRLLPSVAESVAEALG